MNETPFAARATEKTVTVSVSDDTLTVDLADGRTISVPVAWYPRLANGSPAERANVEISGAGHGLHWPDLDEDIGVEGPAAGQAVDRKRGVLRAMAQAANSRAKQKLMVTSMNPKNRLVLVACVSFAMPAPAADVKQTELYARIKAAIDAVPAIDTHEHLRAFDELPGRVETPEGRGMTLYSIWAGSYYRWTNPLAPWPADGKFDTWWADARDDFDDARATSFYRYMLPAFRDLYGIDFDTITDEEARRLNQRIFDNYKDDRWLNDVVTRRANIELMLIDPYWARMQFAREYRFSAPVLNVTTLMSGSHPDRFASAIDSPYEFAKARKLKTETLDDYLAVVESIFEEAVRNDAVCLKSTQAYQRTLRYERATQERAEAAWGRPPGEVSADGQRGFEDFMFWKVCELSAKYDLPFQVHTGQARVQGSNPILLVDVIEANPRTKFILFHGGYPWVGETGVIAMRHHNVWIDSVWLPTLSYTMAKRAYQEWLEAVPSNRIMWGADTVTAEGIYAATEFTRQCLAEALAEKVERGELREEHALRIGRQIMRENALELFPKLRRWLWREAADKAAAR